MEDLFLHSLTEFGFPAILSVILLTKGFSALDKLTSAVNELTKTVEKMSGVNDRLDKIEHTLLDFLK